MASNNNLQYIVIDDFTPGIYDDFASSGTVQAAPKGAAQLTNTYGCIGDAATKALKGAPNIGARSVQDNPTSFSTPWNGTHTIDSRIYVIGMRNIGPVFDNSLTPTQISDTPDMTFVAYQYYYDSLGNNTNYALKTKHRAYKTFAVAAGPSMTPATYDTFNQSNGFNYNPGVTTNSVVLFGSASIDITRANNTNNADYTGSVPTVFGTYCPSFSLASSGGTWAYPANATPGTDSVDTLNFTTINKTTIAAVMAHQDRIIGFDATEVPGATVSRFGTTGAIHAQDLFEFLAPNSYNTSSGVLLPNLENPSGIGSWVSMNANTLMLVKRSQGGVLITGPLEQPTITKMPGVIGTGRWANLGAIGPDGSYIYGTESGIYAWGGGDSVTCLSPQLDGTFWLSGVAQSALSTGPMGKFAVLHNFLFAPNSMLYDFSTGAWWKLKQVSNAGREFGWYDNSGGGKYVVAAYETFGDITGTAMDTLAYIDVTQTGGAYSWNSQPLAEAINRNLSVREINVTYSCISQAGQTITVTLTGVNAGTRAETINVANTTMPVTVSVPTSLDAWDATIRLQVTSGAIMIHRISIGYTERAMAR